MFLVEAKVSFLKIEIGKDDLQLISNGIFSPFSSVFPGPSPTRVTSSGSLIYVLWQGIKWYLRLPDGKGGTETQVPRHQKWGLGSG